MSCNWGIYCSACDASSAHNFNHGEGVIEDILIAAPVIKALQKKLNSGYFEVGFMADSGSDVFRFDMHHSNHIDKLMLENEYGERKRQC